MHEVINEFAVDTIEGFAEVQLNASPAPHEVMEVPHNLRGKNRGIRDEATLDECRLIVGDEVWDNDSQAPANNFGNDFVSNIAT